MSVLCFLFQAIVEFQRLRLVHPLVHITSPIHNSQHARHSEQTGLKYVFVCFRRRDPCKHSWGDSPCSSHSSQSVTWNVGIFMCGCDTITRWFTGPLPHVQVNNPGVSRFQCSVMITGDTHVTSSPTPSDGTWLMYHMPLDIFEERRTDESVSLWLIPLFILQRKYSFSTHQM